MKKILAALLIIFLQLDSRADDRLPIPEPMSLGKFFSKITWHRDSVFFDQVRHPQFQKDGLWFTLPKNSLEAYVFAYHNNKKNVEGYLVFIEVKNFAIPVPWIDKLKKDDGESPRQVKIVFVMKNVLNPYDERTADSLVKMVHDTNKLETLLVGDFRDRIGFFGSGTEDSNGITTIYFTIELTSIQEKKF